MDVKNFFENNARKGVEDHQTASVPFFQQSFSDNLVATDLEQVNIILDDIKNKIAQRGNMKMPEEFEEICKLIGNVDVECNFKCWIFMSLKQIQKRLDLYLKEGQKFIVDFAMRYIGMGHILIVAFDPRDGKIFYRVDGGSNGWERQGNWETVLALDPASGYKMDFAHWSNEVEKPKFALDNTNPFPIYS